MKAKIFIVDDHPIVREGLANLINQENDMAVAGEAGDAETAIRKFDQVGPDLAIVDISLNGTSGIELTKSLLTKSPHLPVLIISMYDEALHVERALRAGAKGYLTKQEATDHVVAAIRKVLGGDVYASDKWKDKFMNRFAVGSPAGSSERPGSSPRALSDRELEVLQLLGQGHATQKIAEEIHVSAKTVESHYANIKEKLGLKNGHELIQYAVRWLLAEK